MIVSKSSLVNSDQYIESLGDWARKGELMQQVEVVEG